MTRVAARARGFTLVELTIALVLMAAIAALLYGSLSLAARTWDGGEAKMQHVSDLRTTQTYLRGQIAAQYPQRMWKIAELPILFSGERDEIRYAAVLPSRVAEGGVYYFRLAVVRNGDRSLFVQERVVPDPNALEEPQFSDAERSILAEDISELRIAYFGRAVNAADTEAPTWLDRWDDKQRLPLLVRIDVKPEKGAAWPTLVVEPRRSPEAGCPGMGRTPKPVLAGGLMRERGIALIAVLWITVLLTVIASGFAFSMRGGALAARNTMSAAQARAAADGAVERVAFELSRPRNSPDLWLPDGRVRTWTDGAIAINATAVDESARIDINLAADPLLKGLLENVGGLDPDTAERVLEAILDWRDADELRRPNGAEADDYRAAGLKYVPTNMRFEATGELQRVMGVTPGLMSRIAGSVTVYSRQRGINPATAPRDSLLALPGMTPELVDAYIASRTDALANQLPVPPLPQAQAYLSAATAVWRIHVEAATPDGVTFARDAVIRPQNDPRQPLVVLLWQEGEALQRPAATDNSMQSNGTSKS